MKERLKDIKYCKNKMGYNISDNVVDSMFLSDLEPNFPLSSWNTRSEFELFSPFSVTITPHPQANKPLLAVPREVHWAKTYQIRLLIESLARYFLLRLFLHNIFLNLRCLLDIFLAFYPPPHDQKSNVPSLTWLVPFVSLAPCARNLYLPLLPSEVVRERDTTRCSFKCVGDIIWFLMASVSGFVVREKDFGVEIKNKSGILEYGEKATFSIELLKHIEAGDGTVDLYARSIVLWENNPGTQNIYNGIKVQNYSLFHAKIYIWSVRYCNESYAAARAL